MLVKKFEETQFGGVEVEFLSRSVIDFSDKESKFPVKDRFHPHLRTYCSDTILKALEKFRLSILSSNGTDISNGEFQQQLNFCVKKPADFRQKRNGWNRLAPTVIIYNNRIPILTQLLRNNHNHGPDSVWLDYNHRYRTTNRRTANKQRM